MLRPFRSGSQLCRRRRRRSRGARPDRPARRPISVRRGGQARPIQLRGGPLPGGAGGAAGGAASTGGFDRPGAQWPHLRSGLHRARRGPGTSPGSVSPPSLPSLTGVHGAAAGRGTGRRLEGRLGDGQLTSGLQVQGGSGKKA